MPGGGGCDCAQTQFAASMKNWGKRPRPSKLELHSTRLAVRMAPEIREAHKCINQLRRRMLVLLYCRNLTLTKAVAALIRYIIRHMEKLYHQAAGLVSLYSGGLSAACVCPGGVLSEPSRGPPLLSVCSQVANKMGNEITDKIKEMTPEQISDLEIKVQTPTTTPPKENKFFNTIETYARKIYTRITNTRPTRTGFLKATVYAGAIGLAGIIAPYLGLGHQNNAHAGGNPDSVVSIQSLKDGSITRGRMVGNHLTDANGKTINKVDVIVTPIAPFDPQGTTNLATQEEENKRKKYQESQNNKYSSPQPQQNKTPTTFDEYLKEVEKVYRFEDQNKAIGMISEIERIFPRSDDLYTQIGNFYISVNANKLASSAFEEVIKINRKKSKELKHLKPYFQSKGITFNLNP